MRVRESNGHGELFKSPVAKISSLREETVDLVQQVNAVGIDVPGTGSVTLISNSV